MARIEVWPTSSRRSSERKSSSRCSRMWPRRSTTGSAGRNGVSKPRRMGRRLKQNISKPKRGGRKRSRRRGVCMGSEHGMALWILEELEDVYLQWSHLLLGRTVCPQTQKVEGAVTTARKSCVLPAATSQLQMVHELWMFNFESNYTTLHDHMNKCWCVNMIRSLLSSIQPHRSPRQRTDWTFQTD